MDTSQTILFSINALMTHTLPLVIRNVGKLQKLD